MVVMAAVVILAIGASGLSKPEDLADPAKLNRDWHMAGAGALVLVAAIVLLFAGAVFTFLGKKPAPGAQQQRLAQKLAVAVGLACPLLFVRIVGSAAFYFTKNAGMSPVSGTWGFRVGLYLVPEVLAAVTLLAGGLVARNVRDAGVVGGEERTLRSGSSKGF